MPIWVALLLALVQAFVSFTQERVGVVSAGVVYDAPVPPATGFDVSPGGALIPLVYQPRPGCRHAHRRGLTRLDRLSLRLRRNRWPRAVVGDGQTRCRRIPERILSRD